MNLDKIFMDIKIDQANIENSLTKSIFFGSFKIPIGILQTIKAIGSYVFLGFNDIFNEVEKTKLRNFFKQQMVHGLVNIVAGIIEFTPIGTIYIDVKRTNISNSLDDTDYHDVKFQKSVYEKYDDRYSTKMPLLDPRTQYFPSYTLEEYKKWLSTLPREDKKEIEIKE